MSKLFKKLFCFDENNAITETKENPKKLKPELKKINKNEEKKEQKTKNEIPDLEKDPFFFT